MTMLKREVNSIWSKVRSDRDVDDIVFGSYDNAPADEKGQACSDR